MKTKKLVIFGSGDMAELAYYYFTNDSTFDVVAFTVDKAYISQDLCCGLPVYPFEELTDNLSVDDCSLFIALSYSKLNQVRKDRYLSGKAMGFDIASYISSKAVLLNDGMIGENCFILEQNTVQPFVKVGNNVTLWSGNHIGHHTKIADHTFIASHVVISGGVEIGEQCFIGVNATLRDHIRVGDRCVIGAGALILENAENDSLYIGTRTVKSIRSSSKLKKI